MLIVFCGLDGSGKTTQVDLLADSLREDGRSVYVTKQPTDWYRKEPRIRSFLDDESAGDKALLHWMSLLSAADRLWHLREDIMPRLAQGDLVIVDRYVFSAYAYMSARGIEDAKWLREINRYAPLPDIAFYLDVPAAVAVSRVRKRDGCSRKKEDCMLGRLHEVRRFFLELCEDSQNNLIVIDGRDTPGMIHRAIVGHVEERLHEELVEGEGAPL